MGGSKIYLGQNEINTVRSEVSGQFVEIDNEKYYQIKNYHEMPDFFISIVSDSDHWMFISSNGSLSAGRKDRDNALFPYYTDDKIHDYRDKTGSKTWLLADKEGKKFLWEPFTEDSRKFYKITRNLYKSIYGNKIIFEEINSDLGLIFSYGWYNSEKFGFVKKSRLVNQNIKTSKVELLDGIQNVLPYGIGYAFQNEYSNLLDAYKKSELIAGTTLGIFMLSAIPVDRAEPSEALKATTIWSTGFRNNCQILISDKQVHQFKNGLEIKPEYDIRASRGTYLINATVALAENEKKEWWTIAEINQDSASVSNLKSFLSKSENTEDLINRDIDKGTINLKKMVSFADGFQKTNTDLNYARHYTNTLFNIMRGGVFAKNNIIGKNDFKFYLGQINRLISIEYQSWLENIPDEISYSMLISLAEKTANTDLIRITYEYLPLTFSRRHGDPSRPWNQFSIETKNENGQVKFYYAGNWRDIFQNWEALCYSYPEFIEGIISKFVNASTIDGYNPYRIMRDGIDWESPDPHDPWSYIGYWGDHQIIYLQKLLELSDDFHPGKLDGLLSSEFFTYANVPYRIKPYNEIIQNPKDTVVFDEELNRRIKAEKTHVGADACLLKNKEGTQIYKTNLAEKILVTLLSKLSNFIPEAGIWLNTQRPEWNDANNALVGNGTSMVTLYYLRRFLKFWDNKFNSISLEEISISEEVAALFESIHMFFNENSSLLEKGFTDTDRKKFADNLGHAHGKYRNEIYNYSFSGEKKQVKVKDLVTFTRLCLKFMDQSIKANKREDGLYHAYNLISIDEHKISIRHLYEMLEGQVAVLSSGYLSTKESLDVLNALKNSKIYRPDQYSYMLYPDRQLPRFIEKNIIPGKLLDQSPLLKKMVKDKETSIIKVDDEGNYHFNAAFRNAAALEFALNELRFENYSHFIEEEEKANILAIYEHIFDHQSFTGRSGTFYGYEGLGSIYWHMVSKLLLATQECYIQAVKNGEEKFIIGHLKDHYYEIKAGIGLYKSPELYGAFPMDAYSHTPGKAGVKQPGLTGQVKEDVISRLIELGVRVRNGEITFDASLMNTEEFLNHKDEFEFYSLEDDFRMIPLNQNQLAFTFCQVPIIYTASEEENLAILYKNGNNLKIYGPTLDKDISSQIFNRTGDIKQINVNIRKI
jgi:hypothetical protein